MQGGQDEEREELAIPPTPGKEEAAPAPAFVRGSGGGTDEEGTSLHFKGPSHEAIDLFVS